MGVWLYGVGQEAFVTVLLRHRRHKTRMIKRISLFIFVDIKYCYILLVLLFILNIELLVN